MGTESDNLEHLLRAIEDGALETLSPEQIERVASWLDARPDLADRVADRPAKPDARLMDALTAADATVTPTAEAWGSVWAHVDLASAARARAAGSSRVLRIWRLWGPLTAAAACLMLVGLWQWRSSGPGHAADWPLELAADAQIESLEVFGDASAFVAGVDAPGAVVIWVLESET